MFISTSFHSKRLSEPEKALLVKVLEADRMAEFGPEVALVLGLSENCACTLARKDAEQSNKVYSFFIEWVFH